jgi:imidazolonepropionase-like amidohydrolase
LRKAIDAGLPREVALRALTLSAAEIYGVGDRLGSLETGKVANLVVTDGDLFEEETEVQMVFIDGLKHTVRESEVLRESEVPPEERETDSGSSAGGQP